MKCRFKTNEILTAVNETDQTVTTADGKVIHKKLASNLQKFQPSKRSDQARKPTNRCRRRGRFSEDEYCETHKRLMAENSGKSGRQQDEASTSKSFPKLPLR